MILRIPSGTLTREGTGKMIERYTLPEMSKLWKTKFENWWRVEEAVLEARFSLYGEPPEEAIEDIAEAVSAAGISAARIKELEAIYEHDLIAFVVHIQEIIKAAGLGQYAGEIHKWMTSYDTEDPAMVLMLREAIWLIVGELTLLEQALRKRAAEHKWTLMIARTHGQYAEPTTFGHLLLVYAEAIKRSIHRLEYVLENELKEAKLSGAVGNYTMMPPKLEKLALDILGLVPAAAETQIVQRDRVAMMTSVLAVAAASIEQIARTLHLMMHSTIRELQEPKGAKARSSSAMSHKHNPNKIERVFGMARLLRGHLQPALENVATLEFREISQSSVERHILPDATSQVQFMASQMRAIVEGLIVHADRMKLNLNDTQGVWATQEVRTKLMEHEISYDEAYLYTQQCAYIATEQRTSMLEIMRRGQLPNTLLKEATAEYCLGAEVLESCFDPVAHIRRGIEHIFSPMK